MRHFVGLDLSVTATGCVVLDEQGTVVDHGVWGSSVAKDGTARERIERLVYITTKVVNMVRKWYKENELEFAIENYAFGAKGAQNDLGEIHGSVKTQIWLAFRGIPVMIPSSHARKKVLGRGRFSKGRAGKLEIIAMVGGRGFKTNDDNEADAYVIAECLRLESKKKGLKDDE